MLFRELRWAILGLALMLVLGSAGYRLIEGWSWFDAVWMVVITLTTIGYGEVHKLSDAGRLFTIIYITLGAGLVGYAFTQVSRYVIEGGLRSDLVERRRRLRMERLTGHVIVVGYGRLGREVVDELLDRGVPVCVLDRSAELVRDVPAGVVPLVGDGTHDEVLRQAGIGRARAIAIATPHAATNVYLTLAARQLNPGLVIITRVDEVDAEEKARRAGATRLIRPFGVGGSRMAQAILHPESSEFVEQVITRRGKELQLEDVRVGEQARAWHGSLRGLDVRQRAGVLVVAIRRPDGSLVSAPHPDAEVRGGDVLVVVGRPADVARFKASVR